MKKRALVFWFTGLSGSGKTTVANGIKPLFTSVGFLYWFWTVMMSARDCMLTLVSAEMTSRKTTS